MKRILSFMIALVFVIVLMPLAPVVNAADEIKVETVNILGLNTAPVEGQSILADKNKITVPKGAPYSLAWRQWYKKSPTDNDFVYITVDENTEYEAETLYKVNTLVYAHSGYIFGNDVQCYYNNDPECVDLDGCAPTLDRTFYLVSHLRLKLRQMVWRI